MRSAPRTTSRQEQVEAVAERALWAALLGMAFGTLYLVVTVLGGEGAVAGFNRFPWVEQVRIYQRLEVACRIVTYSAWIALAALAVWSWGAPERGYYALLAGGLCQLAVPQFLGLALAQQGGAPSPASALIVAAYRGIGSVALLAGALLAGRDLLDRLSARRLQARAAASRATSPPRVRDLPLDAREDRFLGKCWELPLCRPAIKRSCPVFLRGKQPCWRIGVGCMCAEEVLIMAARNRGEDLTLVQQPEGNWRPQIFTLDQLASRLTPWEKRERCMNCAIYLHHQAQKYRAALPTVVFVVVVALAALLPLFHRGFVLLAHAVDRFAGPLSVPSVAGPEMHPALKAWSGRLAEAYVAEWILFACIGLVVLSFSLRAMEYAITERGW